MPLLGAHMSIAGGYYKAVEAAARLGMKTCQIFTRNNNQWQAKPITAEEAKRFRDAVAETGLKRLSSHASYLINLAAADDALWEKSLAGMVEEVRRAAVLGLAGVVVHPGSAGTATPEQGLDRIVAALDRVSAETAKLPTEIWLETTAGQGSSLGWQFEELAALMTGVRDASRLGVCVDTCHIFAAGYPIHAAAGYHDTIDRLAATVGLARVRAWHLNDSLKPFASRVDRHAHIGHGEIGLDAFRLLLNDPRFAPLPMYLETEKGEHKGEDWDAINLRTLEQLIRPGPASRESVIVALESTALTDPEADAPLDKQRPAAKAAAASLPRRTAQPTKKTAARKAPQPVAEKPPKPAGPSSSAKKPAVTKKATAAKPATTATNSSAKSAKSAKSVKSTKKSPSAKKVARRRK